MFPRLELTRPPLSELGLVALVAAIFGTTARFGFVSWDDPQMVVDNPLVRHPLANGLAGLLGTPTLGYPQPATILTQHLDYLIGHGAPWPFHVTNVVLHALSVLLVRRLALSFGVTRAAALFAAALFAVHPVVAEPVSWVTGRKDLLAAFGVLLATAAAREAVPSSAVALPLGMVLALGAKPSGWILPIWLFLPSALSRQAPRRSVTVVAVVAAALALVSLPMAYRAHAAFGGFAERGPGEALRYALEHAALAVRNLLAPLFLSPLYRDALPAPWLTTWGLAAVALALGWALAVVAAWKRRNEVIFFALTASAVAFAPASGLLALRRGPADSYSYLPLAALVLATGPLFERALARRPQLTAGLAGLAVLVYSGLGWAEARIWSSSVTLFGAAVALYPEDAFASECLAKALFAEGRMREGLATYERSVRLGPYPPAEPEALSALGFGYFALKQPALAMRWYGEAFQRYPPDFGRALRFLSAYSAVPPGAASPAEVGGALRLARETLAKLDALPEPERGAQAQKLFQNDLAEDGVPTLALRHLALEPPGEAARLLLALYAHGAPAK